jgi:GntR family transcriptional regulator
MRHSPSFHTLEPVHSTGRLVWSRRRSEPARRVTDLLRAEILEGEHAHGLPSEAACIVRYGVSRNAIREALDCLRAEGWVRRVPGAGTFTVDTRAVYEIDRMKNRRGTQPWETSAELLWSEVLPAPDIVARRLQLPPRTQMIYTDRLVHGINGPLKVRSSWIPFAVGEPLLDRADWHQDMLIMIAETLKLEVGSSEITVEAVPADESTAHLLGLAPGAPVLLAERLIRLADGTPIEFGVSRHRGDAVVIEGRGVVGRDWFGPPLDTPLAHLDEPRD